jgi:hypothetical protein
MSCPLQSCPFGPDKKYQAFIGDNCETVSAPSFVQPPIVLASDFHGIIACWRVCQPLQLNPGRKNARKEQLEQGSNLKAVPLFGASRPPLPETGGQTLFSRQLRSVP